MALWSAPNAGPGHMSHHALNRATAVVSPAARDLWFKCFVTPHCGQSMARTLPFSVVWNPMPRSGLSQLCFGATTRGGGGGAAAADSGSCSCSSASRCAFALTNVRARNSVRVPQFQTHVKTSHNEPYYTNGSTLFGVTMSSKTFAGSMSLSCISMSGPSSPSSPSSSQSCRGIGSMACHTRYSKMTHGSMPAHTHAHYKQMKECATSLWALPPQTLPRKSIMIMNGPCCVILIGSCRAIMICSRCVRISYVVGAITIICCCHHCRRDHDGLLLPPLQNAAALWLHLDDASIALVQAVDVSLVCACVCVCVCFVLLLCVPKG